MTKQATLAVITASLILAACNSGSNAIPSSGAVPNVATPTPATSGAVPNVATPTPAASGAVATPIPSSTPTGIPLSGLTTATPGTFPTAVPNTATATPGTTPTPGSTSIATLDQSALVPIPSSTSNTLSYSYYCKSVGNTYIGTISVASTGGPTIDNYQTYYLNSLLPISSTQAFKSSIIIGEDTSSRTLAFGTYDMTKSPAALINFVQPTIIFDPAASVGAAFTTISATGSTTTTNYLGTTTVTTPLQTYGNTYHYQSLVGTFQQDLYFSVGVGIVEDVVTDGHNSSSCLLAAAPTSF